MNQAQALVEVSYLDCNASAEKVKEFIEVGAPTEGVARESAARIVNSDPMANEINVKFLGWLSSR